MARPPRWWWAQPASRLRAAPALAWPAPLRSARAWAPARKRRPREKEARAVAICESCLASDLVPVQFIDVEANRILLHGLGGLGSRNDGAQHRAPDDGSAQGAAALVPGRLAPIDLPGVSGRAHGR